ncbi:MAG TPA: plastocyanin/azurin family copper-binding protein [Candidatus Nanoarchaeia archaeon]|nr:plastocyanin/azurin family copper-binding protein [Candidatus Nanoarchaeia archaeon]
MIAIVSLFVLGCTSKAPQTAPQPIAPLPAEDAPAVEETVVEEEVAPAEETEMVSENVVEITSSGFSPKTVIINAGETITFINKDDVKHWPASNVHPTHTTYPGSSIQKCGSADESSIFDACAGLETGEEFSFTFDRKGNWPYHDHLSPSTNGVVTVK